MRVWCYDVVRDQETLTIRHNARIRFARVEWTLPFAVLFAVLAVSFFLIAPVALIALAPALLIVLGVLARRPAWVRPYRLQISGAPERVLTLQLPTDDDEHQIPTNSIGAIRLDERKRVEAVIGGQRRTLTPQGCRTSHAGLGLLIIAFLAEDPAGWEDAKTYVRGHCRYYHRDIPRITFAVAIVTLGAIAFWFYQP
ncbi:MAG: hypothetical protein ACYS22_05145 [Planctomycetota bacterium]